MSTPSAASANSLEELKGWAAFHDGQVQAFWKEQWLQNARTATLIEQLATRITVIERRVFFAAGAGAVLGALVPYVVAAVGGR